MGSRMKRNLYMMGPRDTVQVTGGGAPPKGRTPRLPVLEMRGTYLYSLEEIIERVKTLLWT